MIDEYSEATTKPTPRTKSIPTSRAIGREIAKFPVGKNCTISLVVDGEYSKKSIEALVAQLNLNLEMGIFDDLESTENIDES